MKRVRPDAIVSQLQPPRNPRLAHQSRNLLELRSSQQHNQRRTIPLVVSRHHHIRHRDSSQQLSWTQCRSLSTSRPRSAALETEQLAAESAPIPPTTLSTPQQSVSHTSQDRSLYASPPTRSAQSRSSRSNDDGSSTARLSALHARLSLPPEFALDTLARCLVDASADPHPARNNASLAILGQDLLAYYTAEHLMVNYPRLPVSIIFAAQYAYSGAATLAAMRAEWGVELAAAPGSEVNRALLQFKRMTPGNALAEDGISQVKDNQTHSHVGSGRAAAYYRRGMSSRIAIDDEFGDVRHDKKPYPGALLATRGEQQADTSVTSEQEHGIHGEAGSVTAETASAAFIRALVGALSLHSGDHATTRLCQPMAKRIQTIQARKQSVQTAATSS